MSKACTHLTHADYSTVPRADYATPIELEPYLGPRWTICRKTPANIERYGNCITRKQFLAAQVRALAARAERRAAEYDRMQFRLPFGLTSPLDSQSHVT